MHRHREETARNVYIRACGDSSGYTLPGYTHSIYAPRAPTAGNTRGRLHTGLRGSLGVHFAGLVAEQRRPLLKQRRGKIRAEILCAGRVCVCVCMRVHRVLVFRMCTCVRTRERKGDTHRCSAWGRRPLLAGLRPRLCLRTLASAPWHPRTAAAAVGGVPESRRGSACTCVCVCVYVRRTNMLRQGIASRGAHANSRQLP